LEADEMERLRELTERALARQLAAQAELLRSQQPADIQRWALLALEAVIRNPGLEADQPLRHALELLPGLRWHARDAGGAGGLGVTPDGRLMITASGSEAVIRDARTGRDLVRLPHGDIVLAAALRADGSVAATGGVDQVARIWEVAQSRLLGTMPFSFYPRAASPGRAIAFGPTDGDLAVASGSDTITLVRPRERRAISLPLPGLVETVVFSEGGGRLAAASWDGDLRVWDLATMQPVLALDQQGTVRAIALSPAGHHLAAGVGSELRVWDVAGGEVVFAADIGDTVWSVEFCGERAVAAGGETGAAALWEVADGRRVVQVAHGDAVLNMSVQPDRAYLATAGRDGTARVWDSVGREVARIGHDSVVTSCRFLVGDGALATRAVDGGTTVWDRVGSREAGRAARAGRLAGAMAEVGGVPDEARRGGLYGPAPTASRHGCTVAYPAGGGFVLENVATGELWPVALPRPAETILVTDDGASVAALIGDRVRFWDGHTGASAGEWEWPTGLTFGVFNSSVVAGWNADERQVEVLDSRSGACLSTLRTMSRLSSVALSPDGRIVVACFIWGELEIIDRGGKPVTITYPSLPPQGAIRDVTFAPDGRRFATGADDDYCRIWDTASGEELLAIEQESLVQAIAFAGDGRHLVSGAADRTVRVWDLDRRGTELARIFFPDSVSAVAFAAGDAQVWVWSGEAEAHLWRPADMARETARRLNRDLTPAEWNRYLPDVPGEGGVPGESGLPPGA
jgi:WD40 repeat protein